MLKVESIAAAVWGLSETVKEEEEDEGRTVLPVFFFLSSLVAMFCCCCWWWRFFLQRGTVAQWLPPLCVFLFFLLEAMIATAAAAEVIEASEDWSPVLYAVVVVLLCCAFIGQNWFDKTATVAADKGWKVLSKKGDVKWLIESADSERSSMFWQKRKGRKRMSSMSPQWSTLSTRVQHPESVRK